MHEIIKAILGHNPDIDEDVAERIFIAALSYRLTLHGHQLTDDERDRVAKLRETESAGVAELVARLGDLDILALSRVLDGYVPERLNKREEASPRPASYH